MTAFSIDIRRITIQQVNISRLNINVIKEITVHEAMVAFRMIFWQANVLIHVESDNMFETYLARFMHLNQCFIGSKRCATGWQAEHKRTIGSRFKRIDTVYNMAGSPFTDLFCSCQGISLIIHL